MTLLSDLAVGGWHPASFVDYPGRVAAVIFLQGCNFCCPYCHNPQLIPLGQTGCLAPAKILDHLARRRGKLDGVTLSGGEPTLQAALPLLCEELHNLGYPVKLDTNGSNPDMLAELLSAGLVDYLAMDLKAPLERYAELAGTRVDVNAIRCSMHLVSSSGVKHHFRTTYDQSLLSPEDLQLIQKMVPEGSGYVVQPCRQPIVTR